MEKEEALALAKAMEVSAIDLPKPIVPGLTPLDQEEVITIQIQPDVSSFMTFYYNLVLLMKRMIQGLSQNDMTYLITTTFWCPFTIYFNLIIYFKTVSFKLKTYKQKIY